MYVAVKGGEAAIANAHRLLAERRRGKRSIPPVSTDQIDSQLSLGVARVMAEASLYDRRLAALAIKQARGDMIEAIFLLRAYRTTLPRFGYSLPCETNSMRLERRVSATYKDLPGGQLLGPTFDYTHRLLDPELDGDGELSYEEPAQAKPAIEPLIGIEQLLAQEDLLEPSAISESQTQQCNQTLPGQYVPGDLTQEPLTYPLDRDVRLQALARGDEGFLLSMAYSTQRGYARSHPFAGEIRVGYVELSIDIPELGFAVVVGELQVTECQMVNQFQGNEQRAPQFTRGYGFVFGHSERKSMAMALMDRAMRCRELGEDQVAPAQDEEFVIAHADNVQASGFVEHLKLPHYVDFQSELELLRRLRAEFQQQHDATAVKEQVAV